MISTTLAMSVLAPGATVVVVGGGPIQSLAARLSALRGFSTTVALPEQEMGTAKALIFDDANPEGTLPVKLMAISGPEADSTAIETCVENAEGLIICFDNEQAFMPEQAMKIFTSGGKLKHIALMSRYLNGEGMGFFPNAAKARVPRDSNQRLLLQLAEGHMLESRFAGRRQRGDLGGHRGVRQAVQEAGRHDSGARPPPSSFLLLPLSSQPLLSPSSSHPRL